jgi:hypothetical protein
MSSTPVVPLPLGKHLSNNAVLRLVVHHDVNKGCCLTTLTNVEWDLLPWTKQDPQEAHQIQQLPDGLGSTMTTDR